jgi:transposase
MRQKPQTCQTATDKTIKDIRRATRKQCSAEEKIRIVLDGLRGEESIAELCRREGIAQSIYYKWPKEFLEADKRRLAGDSARAASTGEVKALRREARDLKEVVAEQTLKLCTTTKTSDVTDTLDLALQASGCDQSRIVNKPRLLSDNGSSYVSGELAEWLGDKKWGTSGVRHITRKHRARSSNGIRP